MMVKVRQDAWSHEDDLLLAETVLRHIREGSTQLKAFDEVGDILNRTSAACGFRWNAEVRKKYHSAIDLAKRKRKKLKRRQISEEKDQIITIEQNESTNSKPKKLNQPLRRYPNPVLDDGFESTEYTPTEMLSMSDIISALEEWADELERYQGRGQAYEQLIKENEELEVEVKRLKNKLKKMEESLTTMRSDYETFIEIMERARHMTTGYQPTNKAEKEPFHMRSNSESSLQQFIEQSNGF